MSKTMKKVSALLLALLMIFSFMPMTQESAYAAAKKPGKVKNLKVSAVYSKDGKSVSLKITWKKAKNAKKYSVSIKDNGTGLTATKTLKKSKRSLTVKAHFSTSYKVSVKAINGKKKGKAVSKSVKTNDDPTKVPKTDLEKAQLDLEQKTIEYNELLKDDTATKAELEQAKKNLDKASEQYTALDAEARKQLAYATKLEHADWNPEVKDALNKMIEENAWDDKYVVFDYDNTCSIFDVEEQLAVYQLQKMAFAETMTVDKLKEVLATGLNKEYFEKPAPASKDYCTNPDATYQDWIDDIAAAYTELLKTYGPFTPSGITDPDKLEKMYNDADWQEFATKMRAMYDCVFDSESADVAYPWVLYWFTGMSHEEVYDLAYASHDTYRRVPSTEETWSTNGAPDCKIGAVEYTWTSGTQVSENIVELMAALHNNGIDVWVCSASATDPIRAAIDVFGQHNLVTGMMAMTNVYEDGKYVNKYDYETGYACLPTASEEPGHDDWTYGNVATRAQTQGVGKSDAIQNVLGPQYGGEGPIAGFMDSTGDFNFCTEFKDLQVVCCFNRASRKTTDGGGLIAEIAKYQADVLNMTYASRGNDTLYVLQGRDENGFRGFLPQRETHTLGSTSNKLWRDKENDKDNPNVEDKYKIYKDGKWEQGDNYKGNSKQYDFIVEKQMTVKEAIDRFAMKKSYDKTDDYGYKQGFLKKYTGYHSKEGTITKLQHEDWNPEVKNALNDLMMAEQQNNQYVVFDFDNTCSIFDVEEQLALHQLRTMSFVIEPKDMAKVLATELDPQYFYERQDGEIIPGTGKPVKYNADYCENKDARYDDWITDIVNAYTKLWTKYGPFTAEGVSAATQEALLNDDDWKEFSAKIRTMYDLVYDTESAAVAYPWVLYWFTGMTEEQVYQLAYDSHEKYSNVPTERVKFVTPESSKDNTKIGRIGSWGKNEEGQEVFSTGQKFFNGTQVSENIRELMKAFKENGIDVWVCSASATDPIRAAIDVWGLHDYVTGLMAMTNKLDADGKYIAAYDWEGGYAWKATPPLGAENHGWVKDTEPQKTQTQGKGKVIAIQNVLYPKYGKHGPIAGFMDSTGDYNFCTEFKTLQVVTCFNRADRKETDGGGVIAELAVYQAEDLGYDYAAAKAAGDTLYVLQGRDERGLRKLNPARATYVFKQLDDEKNGLHVFGSEYGRGHNETELAKARELKFDTETFINEFAIKTDADDPKYAFDFKYGFVYGQPGEGLGPKFIDPTYNPAPGLDFSGYHSQD